MCIILPLQSLVLPVTNEGSLKENSTLNSPSNADDAPVPVSHVSVPEMNNVEDIYRYEPGGYHPTHLGDTFQNGRYKILHKLGSGGFSMVWLARDQLNMQYVALKICIAQASYDNLRETTVLAYLQQRPSTHPGRSHISFLIDEFEVDGPNGSHVCLVYEVTGSNLGNLHMSCKRLRGRVVRNMARQLIQTVAYLHSEGICHGDLTPMNITLKIPKLDGWSEAEIYERFGTPQIEDLFTRKRKPLPKGVPRYVVQPAGLTGTIQSWLSEEVCLIDFGESFFMNKPPAALGTPPQYLSPSDWFERTPNRGSDIWALGCALFNLRSGGVDLIDAFPGASSIGVIGEIQEFLGPLPERWDKLFFDDNEQQKARTEVEPEQAVEYEEAGALEPWSKDPPSHDLKSLVGCIHDEYHGPPRSEETTDENKDGCDSDGDDSVEYEGPPLIEIPNEEADSLADLLSRLLRYEPDERAPAEDLVDHPWFTKDFPENAPAEDAPPLFQSNGPQTSQIL